MSEYLKGEYEKNPDAKELLKLSKSHKAHSDMLSYPDEDVVNVEKKVLKLLNTANHSDMIMVSGSPIMIFGIKESVIMIQIISNMKSILGMKVL